MAKNGRSKLRAIHCLVSIPADTDYFAPSTKPFMINLQVENLDEVLAQLKREGVDVDPRVESCDYGKFAWIMDPERNRVELWEPKKN